MTFRVLSLIVPLIASSMIRLPGPGLVDYPTAKPILTFTPIEPISSINVSNPENDYFNCQTYGPFSLNNPQNFQVTFTYELHSVPSQSIIERMRIFSISGTVLSASSNPTIYYTTGNRNTPSFTVPLRDYWSANGLTIKFEILKSTDRTVLKEYSASFYPPANQTISGTYLKRNVYTTKSLGFKGDTHDMVELIETYDFTEMSDYLDIDYYYRLDISHHSFLYLGNTYLNYDSAYLVFNDDDYQFPYYTHDSNDDIFIPITLIKNGSNISFKFSKNFYINKRTLQISDIYRQGFALTQDFYLPVNGRNKFNGKQITFLLNGLGLDKLSTAIYMRYDTSRSLVGICKDGDYCIIGGRR